MLYISIYLFLHVTCLLGKIYKSTLACCLNTTENKILRSSHFPFTALPGNIVAKTGLKNTVTLCLSSSQFHHFLLQYFRVYRAPES